MNSTNEGLVGPRHVAVIMDGNGRWAAKRGLPRQAGHKQGVEAVRRLVRAAPEFGIEYLTIYSFSSENWSRPASEVQFLMELLRRFIRQDVAELHQSNVKIMVIGEREGLESSLVSLFEDAERLTAENSGLKLVVAFNYGGRDELVRAAKQIAARVQTGELALDAIDNAVVTNCLDTRGLPDPDLLIRTGGEQRISNFLLWQNAYTEFVFLPEFWPDFNRELLKRAIEEFGSRDRRFGGLKVQTA
ncbi:MAG: isoprenyl transferase [Aestuariivirga sp.]